LLRVIESGAPYRLCCDATGIAYDTFMTWKREDAEFAAKVEATAAKAALRLLSKIEAHAQDNFAAVSWILERRFPELFSRPEVQLNLIQQNNVALNSLSITISEAEVKQIEAQASTERERAKQMFTRYRAGTVDYGNGEQHRILDVETERVASNEAEPMPDEDETVQQSVKQKFAQYKPEQPVAQPLPPILHKEGDEKKTVFWYQFVSGDNRRLVEKRTAFYVVREIVFESVGPRYCQSVVFESEPITVRDVLRVIERLSGPAGWQLLQRKAGLV
jgi:hypothetical protein